MSIKDLKEFLKEMGDPSIEEVHNDLADTLKNLSDNYGEATLCEEGTVCMVKSDEILQTLNALTTAVTWLKVNRENFKD
jgi:hypothetical protein